MLGLRASKALYEWFPGLGDDVQQHRLVLIRLVVDSNSKFFLVTPELTCWVDPVLHHAKEIPKYGLTLQRRANFRGWGDGILWANH